MNIHSFPSQNTSQKDARLIFRGAACKAGYTVHPRGETGFRLEGPRTGSAYAANFYQGRQGGWIVSVHIQGRGGAVECAKVADAISQLDAWETERAARHGERRLRVVGECQPAS